MLWKCSPDWRGRLSRAGRYLAAVLACLLPVATSAEEVAITETVSSFKVVVNEQTFMVTRNADTACPPDCVQPMAPVRGIKAAGALEVLAFLQSDVAAGTGVLIDARLPELYALGAVPGAVNVPALTLDPGNAYRNDILAALGAVPTGGDSFDYSGAVKLVLYSEGITSPAAVEAIRHLRGAGYPVDKLIYFRGGIEEWQALGLTAAPLLDNAAMTSGGTP